MAGLVAVTPAAGFVTPMSGILIGLVAGPLCFGAVSLMKNVFRLDDTLDAFSIHGVGGAWGALATGLFATIAVNAIGRTGLLATDSGGFGINSAGVGLVLDQLVAIGVVAAYTFLVTLGILKLVDLAVGLRVPEQVELVGLDLSEHGEVAYHYDPAPSPLTGPVPVQAGGGGPSPRR